MGHESKVYGLNWPLITKSDGSKFGKTAGGAVWLDPERTSPYEFYQFWLNQSDEDAIRYLRKFTFLTKEEIEAIQVEMEEAPHLRSAQKALGKDLTVLVHSEEAYEDAIRISQALFSGNIKELKASEIAVGFKDVPTIEASEIALLDALVETGLASSKSEARRLITGNAVSINGDKVKEVDYILSSQDFIEGAFSVIRKGKKKYAIVKK
jgi:tyrosyl-tRNA synthetase